MKRHVVVGIGELLWDMFPEGKRLGGAPVNFACHCNQLGAEAYPVSCTGVDGLGAEICQALTALQVDHAYVAQAPGYPTGTVQVTLDGRGKPTYEICEGVAWDAIPMTGELGALASRTDAVCFGSLAQRSEASRTTIHAFLDAMRPGTIRVFDVNLRQAYYTQAIIEASLKPATILKVSDEELPVLAGMFGLAGSVSAQLATLRDRFGLQLVAYTRGGEGSLLVGATGQDDHPGLPERAVDSVGAGDSFTAAMCMGLLQGLPLAAINDFANRVATFVCSQQGATPRFPSGLRGELYDPGGI